MFKFSCNICNRAFYVSSTKSAIEANSCPFCRRSDIAANFDIAETLAKYEELKLAEKLRAETQRLKNL